MLSIDPSAVFRQWTAVIAQLTPGYKDSCKQVYEFRKLIYAKQKHFSKKLFLSIQLSDRVPTDNFYQQLRERLNLEFIYKGTKEVLWQRRAAKY